MTAPRYVDCRCTHPRLSHPEKHAGMCMQPGCGCTDYRPAVGQFAKSQTATAVTPLRPAPQQQRPVPRQGEPMTAALKEPTDSETFANNRRPYTLEQLLQDGKKSASKRTAALAEKIALQLHDLRGRLDDERAASAEAERDAAQKAQARKQIAELEAQLAQARAALHGKPSAKPSAKTAAPRRASQAGPLACPEDGCDAVCANAAGLGAHRYHKHGRRAS